MLHSDAIIPKNIEAQKAMKKTSVATWQDAYAPLNVRRAHSRVDSVRITNVVVDNRFMPSKQAKNFIP